MKRILGAIYRHLFIPMIIRPLNKRKVKSSSFYIKSLKNIHSGKRCFIVGNGPSLKSKDLDKLKNEICFGANGIYNIFDKTNWRPQYYCVTDHQVIKKDKKVIPEKIHNTIFIGVTDMIVQPSIKNANYINMVNYDFYPNLPQFSNDISVCCYEGYTVTYTAIQIAAYMGFKEIYFIGVDHNYSVIMKPDGKLIKQNIDDHFSKNDRILNVPQLYKTTLAYEAAKQYANEHGIKLYNATRGGKLEVFERVDFDSLFKI